MTHGDERKLDEIKNFISQQVLATKQILNLSEAAAYAGISKSYMYKLTSGRQITFYRPASKLIFFKRTELDAWLLQNRLSTISEMTQ
ncbi:MAG: helix-turn-helix domain-containing protein [Chitinophagaceae bacterium]